MDSMNVIHVDFIKPVRVTGKDRVLLRDIWEQLNVRKQFTDWAKQNLSIFNENQDFGSFHLKVKRETGGTVLREFWVTVDVAKEICMMSRTEQGKQVRHYFIECERLVQDHGLEHKLTAIPGVLDSDLLQSLADNFKRLEAERDEAIRTKAQISDRKTATAMNTAAQAVKAKERALQVVSEKEWKIEDLSHRLGESKEWATAAVALARYPELAPLGENRLGRRLAKMSRELRVEVRRLQSERYPGGIGIYHVSAIDAVLENLI